MIDHFRTKDPHSVRVAQLAARSERDVSVIEPGPPPVPLHCPRLGPGYDRAKEPSLPRSGRPTAARKLSIHVRVEPAGPRPPTPSRSFAEVRPRSQAQGFAPDEPASRADHDCRSGPGPGAASGRKGGPSYQSVQRCLRARVGQASRAGTGILCGRGFKPGADSYHQIRGDVRRAMHAKRWEGGNYVELVASKMRPPGGPTRKFLSAHGSEAVVGPAPLFHKRPHPAPLQGGRVCSDAKEHAHAPPSRGSWMGSVVLRDAVAQSAF